MKKTKMTNFNDIGSAIKVPAALEMQFLSVYTFDSVTTTLHINNIHKYNEAEIYLYNLKTF